MVIVADKPVDNSLCEAIYQMWQETLKNGTFTANKDETKENELVNRLEIVKSDNKATTRILVLNKISRAFSGLNGWGWLQITILRREPVLDIHSP